MDDQKGDRLAHQVEELARSAADSELAGDEAAEIFEIWAEALRDGRVLKERDGMPAQPAKSDVRAD